MDWLSLNKEVRLRKRLLLSLLDSDGHVRWVGGWGDYGWKRLPYVEILRAGDAGLFDGDPRQPILALQPPIGNGLLSDFPMLLELWDLLWNIGADEVLKAAAITELVRRAVKRARRAPDAVESMYEAWRKNGGRPDNLHQFLGDHPWQVEHLAKVLGCSAEQAGGLLLGFGHVPGDDGLWRPGEDPESRFLQMVVQLIIHAPTVQRAYLLELMEVGLKELAETGDTGELDWNAIGQAPHDEEIAAELISRLNKPAGEPPED